MNLVGFAKQKLVKSCVISLAIFYGSFFAFGVPLRAYAATDLTPAAKVTFTFDDGLNSSLTQAAPTLAKYGFAGVNYVTTGCIGMTTVPNTCGADEDEAYMTWDQVVQLQNSYGWEIGAHTVSHPLLASNDPDFQTKKLTTSQVTQELTKSKADLAAHGINAANFASPYGDYNQTVLAQIAKLYESHRGFADTGYNSFPYNDYIIRDQQVQAGVSVDTVKGYIDQAIANNQWLVLTFHDIQPNASADPEDYEYSTSDLDQIAAYVKNKSVPVVTVKDALVKGTNLLANSTFDSGLASGWTTDAPNYVKKNTAGRGSYPSPTNSISMTSTNKNIHLFSPQVSVDPNRTYVLKSYMNLTKVKTGYALGYYIDEYDSNGTWISGQYKQSVSFAWPQTAGYEYKPSSAGVAKARLQVIVPANSGIVAYLDNFQWINEGVATPPPSAVNNLVANGTFDAGISGGWLTDGPANIIADGAGNGSPANPVNSVKMTAVSGNTHLFSPKTTLNPSANYNLSTYVDIRQLTSGEVGFYVDEYDASGNWISGQYKTGVRSVGAATASFNYTPTSGSVASASLQIILQGNSGILAYVDNVVWVEN